MPEKWMLKQYQSLPMQAKVGMSTNRIIEWYEHWRGNVCVSFSGGKDSTVLAHIVHDFYPDVPLVFANTGLEYPEIQAFARKMGATFVRPKMSFSEVISTYGYPIISKENAETIHGARIIKNGAKGQRKNTGVARTNENGEWLNWRRKALHGIAPFDSGYYCKTKWLPLARDTQFNISHYCCNVMKKEPQKANEENRRGYGKGATRLKEVAKQVNQCHFGLNRTCCNTSSKKGWIFAKYTGKLKRLKQTKTGTNTRRSYRAGEN